MLQYYKSGYLVLFPYYAFDVTGIYAHRHELKEILKIKPELVKEAVLRLDGK